MVITLEVKQSEVEVIEGSKNDTAKTAKSHTAETYVEEEWAKEVPKLVLKGKITMVKPKRSPSGFSQVFPDSAVWQFGRRRWHA